MAEPADGTRYRIPCPRCGQLIVPKSVRCRYCNQDLHPPAPAAAPAPPATDDGYRVPCPECQGPIVPKAVECRWCGTKLDGARPPAVPAPAPPPPRSEPQVDPLLAPPPAEEPARVPCPQCRELIMPGALKCRFCGSDLRSPAAPALRRAAPRPHVARSVSAAEERSLQNDVMRAMIASIVGTVCLTPCGLVLGPVMLLVAGRYRKRAARLRVPVPGANVGITVCGVVNIALSALMLLLVAVDVAGRKTHLYVDHDYDVALTVEVDGAVAGTVPRDGHARFEVEKGAHRIVVRGARGDVVAEQSVTLERGRKYLLNPGARCSYQLETARYSTRPGVSLFGQEPLALPQAEWRDVSGYDLVFEPFPSTITLSKHQQEATRARLGRVGRTY